MYELGKACIAGGHYKDAAKWLEKASVRLGKDTDLLNALAETYLRLDMQEKAETTYKRIHAIQPYNELAKERLKSLAAV